MSIGISPESEQFIQDLVDRGEYNNRGAVLDEAVQLLKKQREEREQLIRDVNFGVEQVQRGEYGPMDFDKIKSKVAESFHATRPNRSRTEFA